MTQDVYTRKVVFSRDMPNGEVYYYEEEFHMDSATLTERSLGDRLVGVSTKGSSDIIAIRNYQGVPKGGLLKLVPIGNNQKGYKLVDALSNLYDGLDSKAQPKEVTTAKDAPSANDMPRNNAIEHKGKSWVENEEELLESDLNDGMRPWYYDEDELPSDDADFGATAIYRSNRNSPLGADTRGGAHFYHALSNNNSDTLDYSEDNNSLLKASLRGNGLMNGAQHNNNQAQAMVANANNNSTKRTSQSTNSYGFGRFQRTTLQSEPAFKDFYTPKDTSNTSFVTARQLNLGPTKFKTVPASAYAAQANKDRNVAHNYHESNTRISSYVQDGYSFDNTRKEPQIPQAAFSHNPAEKKVQTVSEQKTKFSEQVFQERMENSSLAHLKLPKATTRLAQDENYEPSESAQIFADHYAPYHQAFSHNNSVGPYSYGTEFAAQEHDMLEQTRAYKKLQAQKASAQKKAEPKEDVVLAEFKKAPSKANEKQWWRDRSLTERSAQKAFAMDSFKQTKQGSFIGTPEQYLPKAPEETYNQRVIVTNNYSVDQLKGSASTVISSNASVNGESSVIKDAVYEPVVEQVVEPVVEQVPEQLTEQFKSNSSNQAKEVKEAHISEVYEEPTPAQAPGQAQVAKSQESKPEIKSESAKEQETVSEASASDSLSDNAKSTDDLESTAALKKDVSTKFTGQGAALANAIVSQGGDEEDQSVEDEGGHTNIERNDIKLSPVDKSFVNFKTADGSITEPMEESSFASEDKAPEPGFAVNSSDGTAITTNSKELKHEVEQRDLTANKQEVVATNISSTNNDSDDNTDATITTQGSSNTSFAFGDFKTANGTQANVYYRVPVVSQKQLQAQKEQEEKARQEAERLAILKAEQERIAAEKKAEEERLAAEKAERERLEAERIAAEKKAEEERLAAEKAERERLEAERIAAEKKAEEERLAAEKAEQERLEAERIAAEKKAEEERLAAEKAERERLEAERIAAEKKAEEERLAAEKAEQERLEAERIAAEKKAEEERLAAEKAEQERLEAERIAAEKKAEEERLAAEKAEQERLEAERIAAEKKAEEERLAAEKAEQERLEAERIAAEKKAEQERLAAEKAEQERLEAERIAAEEQAQAAMVKELEAEQARLEAEKEAEQKVQDQLKAERQQQAQQDQSAKSAQQEKAQNDKATTAAAATEVASNKPMTKSQARRAKQKAKAQARAAAAAAAAAATTGATAAANATTPAANASTTSQTQESSKSATTQKVAETKDSLNEQTATAQKDDKDTPVEIQPSPALKESTILAEESSRSMATNLLGSNDSYFNSTDTNSSFDHQVVISAEYTHHGLEEPIENQSSTTVSQEGNILDSISPAYKPADDKTAALLSQSNNIEHGKQEPALSTVPVLESDDDYIQEPQLDLQNSKLETFDKEPELNNVSEVENIQDKEEPSFSANEQLGTIIETVNVEEMADKDLIFATPTRFADNDNTANGEQVNSLSESVFMSEKSVNNKEEHLKDQSAQDSLANFKPMSNEIAASNKQSQAEHDPARAVQAAVADVVEDSLVTDELLDDAFMSDESNLEYMHTTSSHDKGKNKGSNSLANLAAELIDDFDDPFEDDFAQSLNDESKK